MAAMAMYSVMFVLLSLCKFKELHIGLNVFPARLKVIHVEIPEGHDPLETALQLRLLILIHQMFQGLQISFFNAPVRRLHPLINRRFECYAKTGQGWDKNLDSLCSILESELKTLDATFRFHTGGSLMKYTKKERMNIGRQIYEDQINKYEAAGKYGISAQTAREYMRMYRNTNHLPPKTSKPRDYGLAKAKVIPEAAKLDEYQKMSKEDLISALIDARIREERLKLGYEVVEEDDSKKKLITYVKKTAK